ncbi:hypothetical protein QBC39DRAFT_349490 [Podospora conica]|nr:hypothetical protein QBC39DRAFT_349490 [Schizothecium conicum]
MGGSDLFGVEGGWCGSWFLLLILSCLQAGLLIVVRFLSPETHFAIHQQRNTSTSEQTTPIHDRQLTISPRRRRNIPSFSPDPASPTSQKSAVKMSCPCARCFNSGPSTPMSPSPLASPGAAATSEQATQRKKSGSMSSGGYFMSRLRSTSSVASDLVGLCSAAEPVAGAGAAK